MVLAMIFSWESLEIAQSKQMAIDSTPLARRLRIAVSTSVVSSRIKTDPL